MGSRVQVGMLELFPNTTGQVPTGRRRGKIPFLSRYLSSCVFGE